MVRKQINGNGWMHADLVKRLRAARSVLDDGQETNEWESMDARRPRNSHAHRRMRAKRKARTNATHARTNATRHAHQRGKRAHERAARAHERNARANASNAHAQKSDARAYERKTLAHERIAHSHERVQRNSYAHERNARVHERAHERNACVNASNAHARKQGTRAHKRNILAHKRDARAQRGPSTTMVRKQINGNGWMHADLVKRLRAARSVLDDGQVVNKCEWMDTGQPREMLARSEVRS